MGDTMLAHDEFERLAGGLFIDGAVLPSLSTSRSSIVDPATEDRIGEVANATPSEVQAAIDAANRAFKPWRSLNMLTRAELLHEAAAELRRIRPVVAEMLTREMGKPYKESFDEVSWSISAIDYYAEIARHENGKVVGPSVDGQLHFTLKEPLGVVVAVMPFNYPIVLLAWEAAAALAAGNAVIVKPSELTSMTTLKFLEAFKCLPKGLFQCVTGGGAVGAQLVASSGVHGVAFTGGIETGKRVAAACAETFKRCLVEASGNDPFIIMPSAPFESAVRGTAFASYLNCGQVCTSAERIYVHTDIYDRFADALTEETRKLRIGNGLNKVDLGPMATEAERSRHERIVARAIDQGAKVRTGGGRPANFNLGWFVEPTVLTDVTPDMEILNDESFGPVAPLCRVASLDEAIELANRSRYGLGANIYTGSLNEAMRAVSEIESGMVWVNAPLLDNAAGPFGGRKMSGTGRQLGSEGLDQFRHTKFAIIDPSATAQDFWWFPYSESESYKPA
jgi:acyl-CoA reductase-like NAD-dependent aldehyde dehydrogenase